jgi:cytochrome c
VTYDHVGEPPPELPEGIVLDEPAPMFRSDPGTEPLTVLFTDSSYYPEGRVWTRSWDFGDGGSAGNESNPEHTYAAPGEYMVTLTITDDSGRRASVSLLVTAG